MPIALESHQNKRLKLKLFFPIKILLYLIILWINVLGILIGLENQKLDLYRERSGSVVECLTRDRRVAGSSLTGVTALWSLSKTHLS